MDRLALSGSGRNETPVGIGCVFSGTPGGIHDNLLQYLHRDGAEVIAETVVDIAEGR
jgi:hypothetical protein